MKGVVFQLFNQLVETQFGYELWDQLLEDVQPASEGVYVATDTYSDEELLALVQSLSNHSETPIVDLVRAFGEYMFPNLAERYPVFVQEHHDLKIFLKTVHDVIHVEVKKLFPESGLPTIEYEDPADNQLIMIYRSPRKLCYLSEGLIYGAAKHFSADVQLEHPVCMHQGHDHCRLQIVFD